MSNAVEPQVDFGSLVAKFGLNFIEMYGPFETYITNDDIYRRLLTWHFYKGDGKYFDVNFLKRRIWRFCYCKNGVSADFVPDPITAKDPVQKTAYIAGIQQISVSFGVNRNVTIRFILGIRTIKEGAICNEFGCNGIGPAIGKVPPWDIGIETKRGITLNDIETTFQPLPPIPLMHVFKQAVDLGVVELPYQFNYTCNIG